MSTVFLLQPPNTSSSNMAWWWNSKERQAKIITYIIEAVLERLVSPNPKHLTEWLAIYMLRWILFCAGDFFWTLRPFFWSKMTNNVWIFLKLQNLYPKFIQFPRSFLECAKPAVGVRPSSFLSTDIVKRLPCKELPPNSLWS